MSSDAYYCLLLYKRDRTSTGIGPQILYTYESNLGYISFVPKIIQDAYNPRVLCKRITCGGTQCDVQFDLYAIYTGNDNDVTILRVCVYNSQFKRTARRNND